MAPSRGSEETVLRSPPFRLTAGERRTVELVVRAMWAGFSFEEAVATQSPPGSARTVKSTVTGLGLVDGESGRLTPAGRFVAEVLSFGERGVGR
ncbi:MAG: hypothetical protein KF884_10755 [Fimbriimonadaceae bacterium]|nr:hypothetical protein [Fimbriimonadaceae bacterium]QYK58026.1 MAG: hypothetical protein KF884_10755 [Fimbriimonadaceae bacterium]